MSVSKEELAEILAAHLKWRRDEEGGRRADLRGANLGDADLRGANLHRAYLRGANLRGADLRRADLRRAYLRGADLRGADLRGANLGDADLRGANLHRAYLRGADLHRADLRRADLRGANLVDADLRGADLRRADLRGADLPTPSVILLAEWGACNDETTVALMRLDASAHPEGGKAFRRWVETNRCPYDGCRVQRAASFTERKNLWSAGKPPSLWRAMCMVLDEHCPGWRDDAPEEE